MSKMGAVLAAGILDAGGRNATLGLRSTNGHKKLASIVGVAMFCQMWYWFPLGHFLSLAFTPTAVIGLNKDLQVPLYFLTPPFTAPHLPPVNECSGHTR
jgi:26S proteasome regulatory subunit N2